MARQVLDIRRRRRPVLIDETALLHAAGEQLRHRSSRRAVEIADHVLRNALGSSRRSLPVRLAAPRDYIRVSDQVIITLLRRHVDDALEGAAVGRIRLLVDPDETLRELSMDLFVQYGRVLVDVADQARTIADTVLAQLLGDFRVNVAVVTSHVHISEIAAGDPHLMDPADEPSP